LLIGAITHAQGNPDLRPITRLAKPYISAIEAGLQHLLAAGRDPDAGVFYKRLVHGGFAPNDLIDVLPQQRIIYVCVPKNASTRIKLTLSLLLGRNMRSESDVHRRKLSGLKSPKRTGLVAFHRIATDPLALRFAFVRNPYERLVSCWLDKFRGVPLTEGRPSVASYLAWRERNDRSLPYGPAASLSFAAFVHVATATAGARVDAHWHRQAGLLDMPGIQLDLIGRIENFKQDFMRVLDHAQASAAVRAATLRRANASGPSHWWDFYTHDTAIRVYKAYEVDFDRFGYPRFLDNRWGTRCADSMSRRNYG
jgi:hypothetical protein